MEFYIVMGDPWFALTSEEQLIYVPTCKYVVIYVVINVSLLQSGSHTLMGFGHGGINR